MKPHVLIAAFIILMAQHIFACDAYLYSQILQSGGQVTVDNSCSSYDVKNLARIGKDRLTVIIKGFSAYDANNIALLGPRLIAEATDFSAYDMKSIASRATYRLSVNMHGYSSYDAANIVRAGASFALDKSFSTYDINNICQAKVKPATGKVYSAGFSNYDLQQISNKGCDIIQNGSSSSGLSASDAANILRAGGSLEIKNQYSAYDTKNLAQIGKSRLTVHLQGFSAYDSANIVKKGINFYLDNSFSTYDIVNICRIKVGSANGSVYTAGISNYDQSNISKAGCGLISGSDPF